MEPDLKISGQFVYLLGVLLIAVLLSACETDEDPVPTVTPANGDVTALAPATETVPAATVAPTDEEAPSDPSPTAPSATDPSPTPIEMEVTPEAQPNPTLTPTAGAPTATADPRQPTYNFYISYTITDSGNEENRPPAGQTWLIVVATAENVSGPEVTVRAEDLALITADGTRYQPDPADEETQPPLLGQTLAPGENFLGLLRFTVPEGAAASSLEWCADGAACEMLVTVPVP